MTNIPMTSDTYNTTTQKFGTASLNGGSGESTAVIIPASGDYTVECWGKISGTAGGIQVILGEANAFWMGLEAGGGHAIYSQGSGGGVTTTTIINDGAWHHIALAVGASGVKLFIDGAVAASAVFNSDARSGGFGVRLFGGTGGGFAWTGEVDEVAVWSSLKYTGAFTPPSSAYVGNETNLTHLYHLDSNGTDSQGSVGGGFFARPYYDLNTRIGNV